MVELEVSQVRPNPRQPRRVFDDDAIHRLADSMHADGIVQPIVVRDTGDGYEIVAGERRWRAARIAGLRTIPSIVRSADDRELLILALAENVAREDLNPVEQARAYAVLADELDLSQTEIARRVGKSRPAVANTMRLLELPDEVLELISAGTLSEGHGRALLQASGQDERVALARIAVARGWSVRDVRGRGQAGRKPKPGQARAGDDGRRARPPRGRRRLAVAQAARRRAPRAARRPGRDPLQLACRARPHRRPAARRAGFLG